MGGLRQPKPFWTYSLLRQQSPAGYTEIQIRSGGMMRGSLKRIVVCSALLAAPLWAGATTLLGTPESAYSNPDDFSLDTVFVSDSSLSSTSQQCEWYQSSCTVTGSGSGGGTSYWGWGGGGSYWGGGYDTSRPDDSGYDSGPRVPLYGRTCPEEQAATYDALDLLYHNSPTSRDLIDRATGFGVSITLVKANLAGYGAQAPYDPASNTINWDPTFTL